MKHAEREVSIDSYISFLQNASIAFIMNRRKFILSGATATTVAIAGCAEDEEETEPEPEPEPEEEEEEEEVEEETEPEEEPADLPPGLTEDGVDLSVLRGIVDSIIMNEEFRGIALRDIFEDGDLAESQGRSASGITDERRGKHVWSLDLESVDQTINDGDIGRTDYYDGDISFRKSSDGDTREWDRSYERYIESRVIDNYVEQIFEILHAAEYDTPEWDEEMGRYIVPAERFTDPESVGAELVSGSIHVSEDGIPIRLYGEFDVGEGQILDDALAFYKDSITIETPEWVEELKE